MWSRLKSALQQAIGGPLEISPSSLQSLFDEAVGCLQAGDCLRAEETVHRGVTLAAQQAGEESPLYVQALFNEAIILCGVGDLSRAATACRAAAAVPAKNKEMQKERLTCLMNLGEILTRMDELEEAEQVLRRGLEERRAFYGEEHPGYAYGLAPLAENLLAQGRADEAIDLANRSVEINWKHGNPQVASDIALRLFVIKAAHGPAAEGLEYWPSAPPDIQQEIVDHCLDRADRSDLQVALAALWELRRLQDTPDRDVAPLLNVNIALANVARLTGDHDLRIEANQMAVKLCGGLGDPRLGIEAQQALAYALADAGRESDAEQAYDRALEQAQRLGDRQEIANVLRNYAIWADGRDRTRLAETLHRQAVENAAASGDPVMHGRTLAALGVFLQHRDRPAEAEPVLKQSLQLLSATDPDAFCAQTHWEALQRGEACSCGSDDDWEALSALVDRRVKEQVGGDLVRLVAVAPGDERAPDIHVELSREPRPDELERLNRIVNQTLAEMRKNYRRAGFHRD